MAGMDKMTVMGRREILSFTFPPLMTTVNVMINEQAVNTQLIANMEIVSALVLAQRLTSANIAYDSTSTVVGPSCVS